MQQKPKWPWFAADVCQGWAALPRAERLGVSTIVVALLDASHAVVCMAACRRAPVFPNVKRHNRALLARDVQLFLKPVSTLSEVQGWAKRVCQRAGGQETRGKGHFSSSPYSEDFKASPSFPSSACKTNIRFPNQLWQHNVCK